ncbi:aminoglycoside phosphotransferase family protein [Nakamurella lactea]|uniref:aminoglycoside phosphotransferase family protein n=1 Tax=Nakamurella lactea TaxID=459515 RepID=UPI0004068FFD|nr:aminoglycoside phosphotransferase family protein [Nakamurella lactea]
MRKSDITHGLIRGLLAEQFPQWAELPIRPVDNDGWDNLTLRLGDTMSLRFPSADVYVPQVAKEHRWLPVLRPRLPVAIPNPLGKGEPGAGFPRPWSVYEWLPGEPATPSLVSDPVRLAGEVAGFLTTLRRIDATGGPEAGPHSFFRGAGPGHWDDSARAAIDALADLIDAPLALDLWRAALTSEWGRPPVWFHGDMSGSNLLLRDGALGAVIDFGTCGVGDPACDLVIAWSLFEGAGRALFRAAVGLDDDTWTRARGWMLWKAAVTARNAREESPDQLEDAGLEFGWRTGALGLIDELLTEHRNSVR